MLTVYIGIYIKRNIQTMGIRSSRRLLVISYTNHITNEKVWSIIRKAIGPYEELLFRVQRCKILSGMGIPQNIPYLTRHFHRVRYWNIEERAAKLLEGRIQDWTSLELSDFMRRANYNRTEWRRLVVRSCCTPTVHKTSG